MTPDIDYSGLPESLQGGVQHYIEHGIKPGGFLCAVIANDLKESFGRADILNRALLFEIVEWFYNEAPEPCWGSQKEMNQWMAQFEKPVKETTP